MDTFLAKLQQILANIKPLISNNWRYFAFFSCGSFVSLLLSYNFAYKLSGYENQKQFLFAMYLKYKSKEYNNATSTWRLSKYISIRPSSKLMVLDQFYYNFIRASGDKTKRKKYLQKPLKERIKEFKKLSCSKSTYDINPTLLPFGSNKNLINKYIQEIKINNFRSLKINYPGTEISNNNNNNNNNNKINLILAFHGGSNCGGSPDHYRSFCVLLSKLTISTCYSIGYGLAPDYIMPIQVDHVINAYKYILNQYKDRINKIFLTGHSGGGNITLLALQKMLNNKNQFENIRFPDGAIVLSPNLDRSLEGDTFEDENNDKRDCQIDRELFHEMEHLVVGNIDIDGIWKSELERINMKEASLSPLFGTYKGLCDLYVYCGLNECLLSQHQQFVKKCKENEINVEYEFNEWLPHNGPLLCDTIIEARDSCVKIAQWIKKRL